MRKGKLLQMKPLPLMLIGVAILFGSIFGFKLFKSMLIQRAMRNNAVPIVTVSAMPIHYQWWKQQILTYGSLRAVQGVNVTTELAGLVRAVYFKPGSLVKAGDILVQLNADSDVALLHSLQAQEKLAEINYRRDKAQFAIKAVSKAVLDTDEQNLKNLQAQVAEQAATVAKKTLVAPFSGRLGVSSVNIGQYLNVGDSIVTLQTLNPIYADFYIPQQDLDKLQVGSLIKLKTDTYPDKSFRGKITTINPIVEVSTRNVQIEATIENPDLALYPGMFVSAEVQTGPQQQYLTLPQAAISFNPYGEVVYIIQQQGKNKKGKLVLKAEQSFVKTGEKRGDQITVLSGLKEGDLVVTSGQLKLSNGSVVVINNSVVPENNPAPQASDD